MGGIGRSGPSSSLGLSLARCMSQALMHSDKEEHLMRSKSMKGRSVDVEGRSEHARMQRDAESRIFGKVNVVEEKVVVPFDVARARMLQSSLIEVALQV